MAELLSEPRTGPLFTGRAPAPSVRVHPATREGLDTRSASLSYELLRYTDRFLPSFVFEKLMRWGTWVALAVMPAARRHSRDYLTTVHGRPATLKEVWSHFFAYTEMFVLRSRLAEGRPHRPRPLPSCADFTALMNSHRPALLGTFHVGNSDLLGFLFTTFGFRVHMIRLRMANSRDTHRLADRFGEAVSFIWVNQTENLLFAVKQAAESGQCVALKCDRPEHSSKLEAFDFLGQPRLFPFTIYHLAILFKLPVIFCFSVPGAADESLLHGSPLFQPDSGSKAENLARGRAHFQAVLRQVEALIRANPYLWFNFTALNPAVPGPSRS